MPAETPPVLNGHAHPSQMRLRISEFEQATVSDVMIPRADIVALDVDCTLGESLAIFAEEAHSRLPVYRESLDEPVGFVHIKDVVSELAQGTPHDEKILDRIKRKILFVPPSMPLAGLLVKMQASRIHLSLVVDEYGGTDGLVSLEDLVEEIVGDIEDEHDEEAPKIVRRSRSVFEVDARMEIEDFQEATGHDLSLPDVEYEIDTLGGIAFALAGRIPVRGEVLRHPSGCEIEIMDGDSRRIRRLRLRANPAPTTSLEAS
ncbi:MAG: hemolysin family protein [Hyphomonadaceae bacterium]|nr:hemolysin family protein [Hyphomonadaceae bacterium]